MPSIKETKETIKLRAETLKQITANRVKLEKDCMFKHFDRIVKWQELAKELGGLAKSHTREKEEIAKLQKLADDAGSLRDLSKNIRDSAEEQLKLVKDLDLTADKKALLNLLKKIDSKQNETENHYKLYVKEKKNSGVAIKQWKKEMEELQKKSVGQKIKDAFDHESSQAPAETALIGAIVGLVREYLKKEETDLP